MKQRVLIGSGGREHACTCLAHGESSPRDDRTVFVCPGNGGIAKKFECVSPPSKDMSGCVSVAKQVQADLVVVGPEQTLTRFG